MTILLYVSIKVFQAVKWRCVHTRAKANKCAYSIPNNKAFFAPQESGCGLDH